MTAPDPNDPLVCINTRAAGGGPTCDPNRGHCVRCQLCKHACGCRKLTPLDESMLALALDAYAKHAGGSDWKTFTDRVPQHVADNAARVLADSDPSTDKKWDELQSSAQYRWAVRAKAALAAAVRIVVADDLEMFTKVLQEIRDEREISSGEVLRQFSRRAEQLRAQS